MMKQRLIGAAVLIALGVIFIPMLLTGDGKFFSDDSDSNVPPKPMYELEAPKVLPLNKRSAQSSEPVAEAAPRSDKTASEPAVATVTSEEKVKDSGDLKKEQVGEAKSTAESGAKTESPEKAVTVESSTAKTPKVQEKAVPEPVKTKEPAPPKLATEPSTNKDSSTKSEFSAKKPIVTGWVVQLGSFSVQKNALKLRDSLRKNGHASFVEEYTHNGKKSYRVRVGPEQTRELANELKKKLKAETKLDGFVIEFPGK